MVDPSDGVDALAFLRPEDRNKRGRRQSNDPEEGHLQEEGRVSFLEWVHVSRTSLGSRLDSKSLERSADGLSASAQPAGQTFVIMRHVEGQCAGEVFREKTPHPAGSLLPTPDQTHKPGHRGGSVSYASDFWCWLSSCSQAREIEPHDGESG